MLEKTYFCIDNSLMVVHILLYLLVSFTEKQVLRNCVIGFAMYQDSVGNHGCYKFKEKAIWGEHIIVLWIPLLYKYPSPDAKIFQQSADTKVQCVSTGNILPEVFFQPTVRAWNFFWDDGLVQEFFSYAYALAGVFFFFKSPTSPQKVKWSAPKRWEGWFCFVRPAGFYSWPSVIFLLFYP